MKIRMHLHKFTKNTVVYKADENKLEAITQVYINKFGFPTGNYPKEIEVEVRRVDNER